MDAQSALRYLRPHRVVIAICACAPRAGTVSRDVIRKVHALISDDVGRPRPRCAIPLDARDTKRSFVQITQIFEDTSFASAHDALDDVHIDFDLSHATSLAAFARIVVHSAFQSLHALASVFAIVDWRWSSTTTQYMYEPNGPIACFLRKVNVAFASLDFEGQAKLRHALEQYVREESDVHNLTASLHHSSFLTKVAIESLVEGVPVTSNAHFKHMAKSYVHAQRREIATNLALQNLPTLEPQQSTDMALPATQFAMHLEALRRRDCSTAAESLHRYFDLTLSEIANESAMAADETFSDSLRSSTHERFASRRRSRAKSRAGDSTARSEAQGHQYAALSLAIMHFKLGNYVRSSEALDDAIRAAQQCGDNVCQARALMWLVHASRSPPKRHQLLRHADNPLALAKEELETVATPFAHSARMSLQATNWAGESDSKARTRPEDQRETTLACARLQRIQSRVGLTRGDFRVDSLLVSAAAWASHASVPTALKIAEIALRIARTQHPGVLWSGEACALSAVASLTAIQVSSQAAIRILDDAVGGKKSKVHESFAASQSSSFPERDQLLRCRMWLKFENSLCRCDNWTAESCLADIEAFAKCKGAAGSPMGDEDLHLDVLEARCKLHLANGSFSKAFKEADALRKQAAAYTRGARVVDGLRLAADAHLRAGSSSSALPLALGAVTLSRDLGLAGAHVESTLTLAETMLRIEGTGSPESAEGAMNVLISVLAKALEGLGVHVRARARRLQAECTMAASSGSGTVPYDEVISALTHAIDAYTQAEDLCGQRHCLYLLGKVFNDRGDLHQRDKIAKRFRTCLSEILQRQKGAAVENASAPAEQIIMQDAVTA